MQIQQTIRSLFAGCTVLTVAHRLHTVIESDRLLVMDNGVAVEFAAPHELLQQPKGVFYQIVQSLGTNEMAQLIVLAREKYESKFSRNGGL